MNPCSCSELVKLQILDCYVQLNDWGSVLEWQDTYTKMRGGSLVSLPQPSYSMDMCLIKYESFYFNVSLLWLMQVRVRRLTLYTCKVTSSVRVQTLPDLLVVCLNKKLSLLLGVGWSCKADARTIQ